MKVNKLGMLKVGDSIFVVQQKKRGDTEHQTSHEIVSKVGVKYAFFVDAKWGTEYKFCKHTGQSAHSRDSNARSNGYGFDVYLSGDEWLAETHAHDEHRRLSDRICDRWGRLKPLPHEAVVAIHKIIDEWVDESE